MSHAINPDELLEVTGHELRTVVANNPGVDVRIPLAGTLNDYFNACLAHVEPDLSVHDETAEAVEQAVEEENHSAHVDVGNINVPVLMRALRVNKTSAFE
jgi:hypothetical protein